MSATVRQFHPVDMAGVYRVCARVDGAGRPAPLPHANDDFPGHLYAGPYATADPGLAFVLVDADGVGGYIVATADAAAFRVWAETFWWPPLRSQYPPDGSDPVAVFHRGFFPVGPELARHPAQLHMKIDPRFQGRGWGRALIERCTAELRRRDVPGVHLMVAGQNRHAIGFYRRLGFTEAVRHPSGRTFVLDLSRGSP
ncbi:GNAT family N-acetyltransferase [Actinoplanes sp. LDG1-06]|uniref:GNAT family N-acetyltransferase n=1 Tax=Paractinoplanes ovalisporus TaxID=2810368 RepID=A0ABS2A734_9ACTN|nr:N-acetyltransferase [Actinoplanes ovalisporus]MBM2615066.1 GNAT family N-acetyltransferase [Actinoplanes ovalisporus]